MSFLDNADDETLAKILSYCKNLNYWLADFDFLIISSKFALTVNILLYVDGQVNLARKINCKESQVREMFSQKRLKKG